MTICRIVAPAATVADRLVARETGLKRDFLLRVTSGLEERLARLEVEDFRVENDACSSLTDVALEVLRRLSWPASTTWPH